MTERPDRTDPRLRAERYRAGLGEGVTDDDGAPALSPAEYRRAAEIAVDQAIRRGDFDDLPGTGKPLTHLAERHDPDWWIRRKIERERITGIGPPALMLRTEHRELDARLDALTSEGAVREVLEDFNARVIAARRQLEGGPPVVTPTRDVEAELRAWRERRDERRRTAEQAVREREEARAAMTWRERRRARRRR